MEGKTVDNRRNELRSKIAEVSGSPLTDAAVKRRKKLVDDLLILDVGAAMVRECLSSQRIDLDREERLSKFPHISPGILQERLSIKPASRPYLMMRALSLPEDFRTLPDGPCPRSWEDRAVLATVVHPEKLPYDLLSTLGLVPPGKAKSESHSRYVEELRAKIAAIPDFKALVANSRPFAGSSRSGGRAVALTSPGNPADGMILAFHTVAERGEGYRIPSRLTTMSAYPDAYAYLRSRYYAEGFLAERETALRKSAATLARLIVEYDAAPDDSATIAGLRASLDSRRTFFEQRAYLDRLLGVKLRNSAQDRLRIKGAFNDIQQGFLDRMGKLASVRMQAKTAEISIERESGLWKTVYRNLRPIVIEPDSGKGAIERGSATLKLLDSYRLSDTGFHVRPFSIVRTGLADREAELAERLSAGDASGVAAVLEKIGILLRAQAFLLFRYGLEHSFKTDSLVEGGASPEKLSEILDRKFAKIESMVFSGLPDSVAKKGAFRRFADVLEELRVRNASGNFEGISAFLEEMRKER